MAEVEDILCPTCRTANFRKAKHCKNCGSDIVLNNDGPRRYKITGVIKQGGQGAVYRAIEVDASGAALGDRAFAVKEMLDRFTDPKEQAEALARFETEAHLLERLNHPRIPKIYSDFKDDGRHYLAMDFVRGEDMEQVLQREGALSEARVLEIAEQLSDVLDYLHAKGFIYRDMKPSNIMIDHERGGIKLVDFGIAKLFQPAERGTQIGTPGYAPPEQYQGLATPESDVYALGATLHHMLTGRDPRDEKPFSFPPVRDLKPQVSKRTAAAIAKALQWKAEDRYRTVAEFWRELRPLTQPANQVRVAPRTSAIPAQPQMAARPAASAPVAVPAAPAARPLPTSPPVAAAPVTTAKQPAPRQRPSLWRRLRNFLLGLLIVAALLGGGAAVVAWQYPELIDRYLPGLVDVQPSQPVLVPQTIARDVEVTVPSGTDEATVRQRLAEAYTSAVQAEFGPEARVNTSSLAPVGGIENLGESEGQVRYRARMQALVSVPST